MCNSPFINSPLNSVSLLSFPFSFLLSLSPLSPRTEDERDVFNEKPSKEEMMAATQVGGVLCCHGYLHVCIV